MSVLLPSSVALLRGVRALRPMFSNMIVAELFAVAHSRGELSVLPTTDGAYVVFDRAAPNGRCVRARCATLAQAHAELVRLTKTSEVRRRDAAFPLSPAEPSAEPALPRARASATSASSRRVAAPAKLKPGIETRAGTKENFARKGVET